MPNTCAGEIESENYETIHNRSGNGTAADADKYGKEKVTDFKIHLLRKIKQGAFYEFPAPS